MNTFEEGITLRQLQKEWEMHVQHRSGKATSRIMSFLGLGPRVEIRDPQSSSVPRKKKKKKKPRMQPRMGPAEVAPSGWSPDGAARAHTDSADENSKVFIKRKPIPQSVTAKKKPLSKPSVPKHSKPVPIAKGSALERVMKNSPFHSPVVPLKVSPESPVLRPNSAPAGGAVRSPTSPIRFPGDDIPPDVFCTFPPEEVQKFLVQNGFGHYVDRFLEMGIWGEDLLNSDDSDLQSCGVSFKPHRRRLLSLMDCIFNNKPSFDVPGANVSMTPPGANREPPSVGKMSISPENISENDFVVSRKTKHKKERPSIPNKPSDIYMGDKGPERPFDESQEDASFLPPGGSENQMPSMNRDASNYQVTSWIDTIGNSVDNAENTVEQVLIQNSMLGGLGKEPGTQLRLNNDFDIDDGGLVLQKRSDLSPTREELLQSLRAAEAEVERIRTVELEQLTAQLEQHRAFIARKKELQRAMDRSAAEELSRRRVLELPPEEEKCNDLGSRRSIDSRAVDNVGRNEIAPSVDSVVALDGQSLTNRNDQCESTEVLQHQNLSLVDVYKQQESAVAHEEKIFRRNLQLLHSIECEANVLCSQAEFSAINAVDNICAAKVLALSIALEKVAKSHNSALEAIRREQLDKLEAIRSKSEEEALIKIGEIEKQAELLRQKESEANALLEAQKDEIRLAKLAQLSAEEEALGRVREFENQTNLLHQKELEVAVLLEAQKDEIRLANLGRLSAEEEVLRKARENTELAKLLEQEVAAREKIIKEGTGENESSDETMGAQLGAEDEADDYEADFEEQDVTQKAHLPASSQVSLSMHSADSVNQNSLRIEDDSTSNSTENINLSAHNMAEGLRERSAEVEAEARRIAEAKIAEVEAARLKEVAEIEAEREALAKLKAEQENAKAELEAELDRHRQGELQRLAKEREELERERAAAESARQQQEQLVLQAALISQEADAQRLIELTKIAEERDMLQSQKLKIEEEAANSEKLREEIENRRQQELARLEEERIDFEKLVKKQQAFQLQQEVDALRKAEEAEIARRAEINKLEDEKRHLGEQKEKMECVAVQSAKEILEVERRRLEEASRYEIERAMLEQQVAAAENEKTRLAETAEIYRQAELSRIALESLKKDDAIIRLEPPERDSAVDDNLFPPAILSTHDEIPPEVEKSNVSGSPGLENVPLITGEEVTDSSERETKVLSLVNKPPQSNSEEPLPVISVITPEPHLVEKKSKDSADQAEANLDEKLIGVDSENNIDEHTNAVDTASSGQSEARFEDIDSRDDFGNTMQLHNQASPSTRADIENNVDVAAPLASLDRVGAAEGCIAVHSIEVNEPLAEASQTPRVDTTTAALGTSDAVDESMKACGSPESVFVNNLLATVQSQLINNAKENGKDEVNAEQSSLAEGNTELSNIGTGKNFNKKLDLVNACDINSAHDEHVEPLVSESSDVVGTQNEGPTSGIDNSQDPSATHQAQNAPVLSNGDCDLPEDKNNSVNNTDRAEVEHPTRINVVTIVPVEAVKVPILPSSALSEKSQKSTTDTVEMKKPGSEWIEVKGSFGGLYYHQSTKEFREPHEIFEQGEPISDVAHPPSDDMTSLTLVRTKAEETTHQPLQKRALHSSNDSEDEVASLMSVSEAINELEDAYLKKKKEKEARESAKFLNMPPPTTPVPAQPPLSMKKQLSFTGRSPSFQEKVKLPYSPSFAELQQQQQFGHSGTSFGTEFNQDFDPMGNLYYGSFKEQANSAKSYVNTQQIPAQPFNSYGEQPPGHDPYNDYISAYEENGGAYQDGYLNMHQHNPGNGGYDYERDLSNNNNYYSTPPRQQFGTDFNSYGDGYGSYQQYEDNPYWKWDPTTQVWVPKEEYASSASGQDYNQAPAPQIPIRRLSSGVSRPAYGIARKKSSSKKSRNSSGSFGADLADFEDQARRGSSQNMLGLAFNAVSSGEDAPATSLPSPRSALKDKKSSLWG